MKCFLEKLAGREGITKLAADHRDKFRCLEDVHERHISAGGAQAYVKTSYTSCRTRIGKLL